MALSYDLDNYQRKLDSYEKIAIAQSAKAFTSIQKSQLLIQHFTLLIQSVNREFYTVDEKGYKFCGLNLIKGEFRHGVLEKTVSKIKANKLNWSIYFNRFATEAVITIFRIDDMIKQEPKKKIKFYEIFLISVLIILTSIKVLVTIMNVISISRLHLL
ncbi:unnamed protein product [Paramecium sonneborni]|uniref:Uncharacterized protein n=1 Tax=Paramecium sonneborni TaxID=65129 RepID=A0A8S1RSU9_9CILI|nr:unnamed protein product [Paramecium sonneborni]